LQIRYEGIRVKRKGGTMKSTFLKGVDLALLSLIVVIAGMYAQFFTKVFWAVAESNTITVVVFIGFSAAVFWSCVYFFKKLLNVIKWVHKGTLLVISCNVLIVMALWSALGSEVIYLAVGSTFCYFLLMYVEYRKRQK
jgi:hypothetical protein